MSAGMWGATCFLAVAAIGIIGLLLITKPEREDPPGVEVVRGGRFNWNYRLEDRRGMWGIGYLTRASAIRAARAELNRLQERDNT